jgi:hypothetical protein
MTWQFHTGQHHGDNSRTFAIGCCIQNHLAGRLNTAGYREKLKDKQ